AMGWVRENAMQVGAVEHEVGRAVAFRRGRAELEPIPGLARAPVTNLPPRGPHRDCVERLRQTERIENAAAVRADLNARAHLPQLRRLLVDVDIEPAPQERERSGKPAHLPTDDSDFVFRARRPS